MIPANNPILSYELNRKVIIVVVLFFVAETSKEFQKDYQWHLLLLFWAAWKLSEQFTEFS